MAHRFKVSPDGPYPHLTTNTIVRWAPVFVSDSYFKIILDSLAHLRQHRNLAIHAYVIMPNHVHTIVTARNNDLSAIMRDFKKFTSRAIYHQAEQEGNHRLVSVFRASAKRDVRSRFKVWQDEFHPEAIYSRRFFSQKLEYIHTNPVRKGLATDASQWYYSSFTVYEMGDGGPLEIDLIEW